MINGIIIIEPCLKKQQPLKHLALFMVLLEIAAATYEFVIIIESIRMATLMHLSLFQSNCLCINVFWNKFKMYKYEVLQMILMINLILLVFDVETN